MSKQRSWNTEEDNKLLRIILSKANLKIDWPTVAREMNEDRTRIACERRWQRIMAKMMGKGEGADNGKVKRGEKTVAKVKVKKEKGELEEDELKEEDFDQ